MTFLGLAVAVFAGLILLGRVSLPVGLAVAGGTPAGAALIVGATAVPTFYAMGVFAFGLMVLAKLGFWRNGGLSALEFRPPAGPLLMVMFAWSVVITLAAPLLFDGLEVLHPRISELQAGSLASSNIAQLGYLFLGVCIVFALARDRATRPAVLGIALGVCLALSAARFASLEFGLPFPGGLFDNSPNFNFIETSAGGGERFRGILAEPAALATTCLCSVAFFAATAVTTRGWRRLGCVTAVAVAAYLGTISTSASFVVAGAFCVLLALLVGLWRVVVLRARAGLAVGFGVCAAIVLAAVAAPVVSAFVGATVETKVGSDSFDSRTFADAAALGSFLDSYGLGVGLGSSRGSSILPTMLSSVGVIGAAVFVGALAVTLYASLRVPGLRAVRWTLIAFASIQVLAGPDLSDPSGVLWISLGVLSHGVARREEQERSSRSLDEAESGPPGGLSPGPRIGRHLSGPTRGLDG